MVWVPCVFWFVFSTPFCCKYSFPLYERTMIPDGSADKTPSSESKSSMPKTTNAKPRRFSTSTSLPSPSPGGVDYSSNPTVFGKILQGASKAKILDESTDFLAFEDIRPRAALHGLVIPKRYIPSILDVHNNNNGKEIEELSHSLQLIRQMEEMAHGLLKQQLTRQQYQEERDYILCFHIPPFNSVDHLHLHVLAPASEMQWVWRDIKYNTSKRWCISLDEVKVRIERGESAVPYTKTDPWWKTLLEVFCPAHGDN